MKKIAAAATCLALAAAGLSACGDDDEDTAATTPTEPAATTPKGTPPADEVKVSMKDIKYVPANVTVKAGQKVTWTNDDPVAHTVTATSGAKFDSGTIEAGETYSQTLEKAGRIAYVCTIHPNQKGSIIVR